MKKMLVNAPIVMVMDEKMMLVWEGDNAFTVRSLTNNIQRTYNDFDLAFAVFNDCLKGGQNVDPFWNMPIEEGRELMQQINILAELFSVPVQDIKLSPADPFELFGVSKSQEAEKNKSIQKHPLEHIISLFNELNDAGLSLKHFKTRL